jgi:hypothetical protein
MSELNTGGSSTDYVEKNVRVMPTTTTHISATIVEELEYSSDSDVSGFEELSLTRTKMKVAADQISRSRDRKS